MSPTVCLLADAIGYPDGGGHLWVYLNWALGLRASGCDVLWLELGGTESEAATLRHHLSRFGLVGPLAADEPVREVDLLVNMKPGTPSHVIDAYPRSLLIDIDPGLTQYWVGSGAMSLPRHDLYFTIGEGVASDGIEWLHTTPCVAVEEWPCLTAPEDSPFTTVAHWDGDIWLEDDNGRMYQNEKRYGFEPFLDLPRRTRCPLELALSLGDDDAERRRLESLGWRVGDAEILASTPWSYREYIQRSRGEFSCAKPSCMVFGNAWISDRTLCYLASGKPCVVQHTGASSYLPDRNGLFRFRDLDDATACIDAALADYEHHSHAARALAEECFDAKKVAGRLLERAL